VFYFDTFRLSSVVRPLVPAVEVVLPVLVVLVLILIDVMNGDV